MSGSKGIIQKRINTGFYGILHIQIIPKSFMNNELDTGSAGRDVNKCSSHWALRNKSHRGLLELSKSIHLPQCSFLKQSVRTGSLLSITELHPHNLREVKIPYFKDWYNNLHRNFPQEMDLAKLTQFTWYQVTRPIDCSWVGFKYDSSYQPHPYFPQPLPMHKHPKYQFWMTKEWVF